MPGFASRPLARTATAVGATAVAVGGLLAAQAFEARRRIGPRTTTAPYADGRYVFDPGDMSGTGVPTPWFVHGKPVTSAE